jgi:hypothetical protein
MSKGQTVALTGGPAKYAAGEVAVVLGGGGGVALRSDPVGDLPIGVLTRVHE